MDKTYRVQVAFEGLRAGDEFTTSPTIRLAMLTTIGYLTVIGDQEDTATDTTETKKPAKGA